MRLHHLHLPRPIPYSHSLRLQEALLERHFADKTALRKDASLTSVAPPPTLLTFQTHPTYTVGRRHLNANPLSPSQISFLTGNNAIEPPKSSPEQPVSLATFYPSPRGGLLTYHAPGQLTAYLVCNLRTHNLTPRCYIRMLENTIMRTCARQGVANVITTEDPGVWIAEASTQSSQEAEDKSSGPPGSTKVPAEMTPTNRKICAIGVQVSRGITSHGIGLNVFDTPIQEPVNIKKLYTLPQSTVYRDSSAPQLEDAENPEDSTIPAPGYLSWGFSRIVACGLEGKSVTWLSREQQEAQEDRGQVIHAPHLNSNLALQGVANSLALEVALSLKIDERAIDRITEEDIIDEDGT